MKTVAVIQPQAKDTGPPEAGRGGKDSPLKPQGARGTLILDFKPPKLRANKFLLF